jgi:hypothetical protein
MHHLVADETDCPKCQEENKPFALSFQNPFNRRCSGEGQIMISGGSLTINVVASGVSAKDALSELTALAANSEDGGDLEFRAPPPPPPGQLAMLDPGTVQVLIAALGGSGAIAIGVRALFGVIGKWIDGRNAPAKIQVGRESLELPPNLPAAERERICSAFIDRIARGAK